MKKTLFISLLTLSTLMGNKLVVEHGTIQAHTEVFGDSNINPATNTIISHLSIGKTITSIRGKVDISVSDLKSTNHKRDEHMYKALETNKYPIATYTFKKIKKLSQGYEIDGVLYFHGVTNPITIYADITQKGNKVYFHGRSYLLQSKFKIKPIRLLFLQVRDKVDLNINVTFIKK